MADVFSSDQTTQIQQIVKSLLNTYAGTIRLKSGYIQAGTFPAGDFADSAWSLTPNNATFAAITMDSGTGEADIQFLDDSFAASSGTGVGSVQVINNGGNNYTLSIMGWNTITIASAFYDGLEWQITNIATFNSSGIQVNEGSFISTDGSSGVSETLPTGKLPIFKNGIYVGHT